MVVAVDANFTLVAAPQTNCAFQYLSSQFSDPISTARHVGCEERSQVAPVDYLDESASRGPTGGVV